MEVKFGLQNSAREVVVDVDLTPDALKEQLESGDGMVSLTDTRGRTVLIAADKVTYVEFGVPTAGTVGFRS